MAIRIYSEHGEECEFDEPEFLTGLPGAGSTGVPFAGEGRQLMEMITSFWTALQVWPSQQGILLESDS
jgi:hypothetical protein